MNPSTLEDPQQVLTIDAKGVYYRDLNARLREAVAAGVRQIVLHNVTGQRYLGTDLAAAVRLEIHGTPGNDLAAFMEGPQIVVYGNLQDGCGNTMNGGTVVAHGRAGDALGYAMRAGKIFVRDDVGYRVGIHMKEYEGKAPAIVVGGTAQPFLGEYMAGGVLVVLGLGLHEGERHRANFIGTGMHNGVIYLRGAVEPHQLGKEVGVSDLEEADWQVLRPLLAEFAAHFGRDVAELQQGRFQKLRALSLRPYGRLYAY
ncbi:MAG: GltB/FmdC/FwdC-like GXGXG domain-containing protein [Chloroflexota bacterium]